MNPGGKHHIDFSTVVNKSPEDKDSQPLSPTAILLAQTGIETSKSVHQMMAIPISIHRPRPRNLGNFGGLSVHNQDGDIFVNNHRPPAK